ncbi:MAG: hypothetical protein GWN87_03835, partial [Desulfuromonadales bacterium]|nr:hypothetical protein [Desulfuromonadales bacterium]NIS39741.1 hypothetical protein [Desulfuromonadales bacterium]
MPIFVLITGLSGCAALVRTAPERVLGDTVISGEETWSGVVRIDGIVTVKKDGKLTILPGTRVLFARNDVDGDGIGDSEILVEGEIVARGTDDAPILFSSAE